MENEEKKLVKAYAIITLFTIAMLIVGILLGIALGRQQAKMTVRENVEIVK